jgi:hypothetical protein
MAIFARDGLAKYGSVHPAFLETMSRGDSGPRSRTAFSTRDRMEAVTCAKYRRYPGCVSPFRKRRK